MTPFPHTYRVEAVSTRDGAVTLSSVGLPALVTQPPAEFGGPGDAWSPETLLTGAIADCYVLSFRAVARASGLSWSSIRCDIDATLDRVDGITRFTRYALNVQLQAAAGTDPDAAEKALHKAKKVCLISNSLSAEGALATTISIDG
ncbi:MAG TPA: OsmC family protein [Steroidobacteraceae bacterium]|nr:OsmC family protein [Steroidobacteraceae bacterium]